MLKTKQTRCVTPASSGTLLTLLETLPDAIFFIDDAATTVYANASAQTITGATREDLCGKPLWRGAPHLVSTSLYQAVQKTKQTRAPIEVEYVSPVTRTWLHVQLSPAVGGLLLHVHEQREPLPRWETFVPDEHLADDVLKNLYVGVGCLTPEGILLEINEVPLADAQIRREEVIGQPFAQTPWWSFYPASQQQLRAAITRASRGETVRFETLVHPREGMDLHLEATITPHEEVDHHVEYLVYVGTDITERKRAEGATYALMDALPHRVWIARSDGSVTYHNQRLIDYLVMPLDQIQGDGWMVGVHPDDRPQVQEAWQAAIQTRGPYEVEHRLRDGISGAYRWFLARGVPQRNAQGTILHWFGTCTDIEDQKRIEEALHQSQERASALMNSNIIGINVIEGEQIVDANDTFLRMTGYTREDLRAGRINWRHMTPPEYLARTQQAHQELATQQSMTPYEKEYVCQDGSRLPVLVGGGVFQHHPLQAITFVLDNSARKELEQRKDDLINMASHELGTPLTAVKMQTQLVRKRLEKQSHHEAATALSRVEGPIKLLERLIGELLDVSRIQAGRLEYVRERVDLGSLLRDVTDTMHHFHPSHTIVVRETVQTSLIGDRDRLGQAFTNLLSNAITYSPDAETVEIDLSASEDAVTVRVRDHGLGILQEQRDKIFERFYRAPDLSQRAIPGLGMGLYIVAEIVKGHEGNITVDSEIGKGSTFTVTLPKRRDA
ncbi:PAS domain S-box protein [Ktedonobacter racemifer]|uniref:histidine kinase n=1 Tax=Ktedonobacter racemifer DSM 44963 TaxID=485913 RepID=D6TSU8_KTERA|nr:PAS domain S-box protein [Ktedonobacter racemifer]EFH83499.1 PAS/PAC sensor signal transduction histidine kinase [Ktedonobacter racemifer DSM 44963]